MKKENKMEDMLRQLQEICLSAAGLAITALVVYMFTWLRTFLGIKESDSNENVIRRAAVTEAGKLITTGKINDSQAVLESVSKVVADVLPAVKAEGYNSIDIKDMILGAASIAFPPAGLLKNFLK
jgi:hypothetical protein